jgi:hypothetical protein
MKYYAKYSNMQSAVVDFNSSSRAMNGYAQRLIKITSGLVRDSSLSSIRSNLISRTNAIQTLAVATTNFGKCVESSRIGYMSSEQRAYQRLNGNNPQTVGGKGVFANFSFKGNLGFLSRWKVPWASLLPPIIGIGPAVVISTWSSINWGFLTPVVDWVKNPFGRQNSKWETVAPKPDQTPEPEPKPEPELKPEPEPEKKPEPKPEQTPRPPPKPREPPNPPGNLTPEEREADLRMYRDAHAVRERYLPIWRAARTEADKVNALNEMLAELQNIKGTSANPEIRIVPNNGNNSSGQYVTSERIIEIRQDRLNSPNSLQILMHELRHAYQAEAIGIGTTPMNHNHVVSEGRKQVWWNTWTYENLSNRNNNLCVDARWFSGGI